MSNHLHTLMKCRTSRNDANPLSGRDVWDADLVLWYGSSNRVSRWLKPWYVVGESGAEHRLPARIRSHMWVEKNTPWMEPHLSKKLVKIFGRRIERESSKRWDIDMIAFRLFLEWSRALKVSCIGERMYSFGGIVVDASCGVWWMGGTVLVNRDGFSVWRGEVAEEEIHPSQLGWHHYS